MERIESQWLQLVGNLPNSEEQLHQAQMELLPSRQALNELLLWLEGIESTICEDTGRILLNLVDTQVMLQKYRVSFFKVISVMLYSMLWWYTGMWLVAATNAGIPVLLEVVKLALHHFREHGLLTT